SGDRPDRSPRGATRARRGTRRGADGASWRKSRGTIVPTGDLEAKSAAPGTRGEICDPGPGIRLTGPGMRPSAHRHTPRRPRHTTQRATRRGKKRTVRAAATVMMPTHQAIASTVSDPDQVPP